MSQEKYSFAMRTIHWLMAALILGLLFVGMYMTELPKDDPSRGFIYGLHKSLGVTVLVLLVVRVVVRMIGGVPALPSAFSRREKKIIHAGHASLYVLMLLVPLSGYLMSCSAGKGVKWFGVDVMCAVSPNEGLAGLMNEAHEMIAYLLLAVVVLHVLAAIRHIFEADPARRILERMK